MAFLTSSLVAAALATAGMAAPVSTVATEALKGAERARHVKKPARAKPAVAEVRAPSVGKLWTDGAPILPRPTLPPIIAPMVKASMPAVVGIVATTAGSGGSVDASDPFHDFLEKMYGSGGSSSGEKSEPVRGIGTGFFIRSDGLVVTNGHVIEGATDIQVQIGVEERPVRAHVIGRDDPTDLALLQVDAPGPFPILQLGDSDATDVGEWVVAIGNPFGLSRTVTTGIISYKGRRDVNPSGRPGYYDFIQTDAAINPGNSGGPLLDGRGFVIGINAAVNPSGQGIGFAIPMNMVKEILPQLSDRGYVSRSWMGLTIQDQLTAELAASFGVPGGKGVLVTEITADGPADLAGLKIGDVITSFDDEPLSESYRLRWLASIHGAGKTVKMRYVRDGKQAVADLVLKERPGSRPTAPPTDAPLSPKDPLGCNVEDPGEAHEGVRISSVDVRGPAYRVGVREGDLIVEIDGQKFKGKEGFRAAIQPRPRSGVTRLYVRRGGRPIFFGVRRDTPVTTVNDRR